MNRQVDVSFLSQFNDRLPTELAQKDFESELLLAVQRLPLAPTMTATGDYCSDVFVRITSVLDLPSDSPLFLRIASRIAFKENRILQALELMEQAAECAPFGLSTILDYRGLLEGAFDHSPYPEHLRLRPKIIECLKQELRLDRGSFDIHQKLLNLLQTERRFEEALEYAEAAAECFPSDHRAWEWIGRCHYILGNEEAAEAAFDRAINLSPSAGFAWYYKASLKTYTAEDQAVMDQTEQTIKEAERQGQQRSIDGIAYLQTCFAYGKMMDDIGDYDLAWQAYERGNNILANTQREVSAEQYDATLADVRRRFTREAMVRMTTVGSKSRLPMLICGLPRTGSSLCEQILRSHTGPGGVRDVTSVGELGLLDSAVKKDIRDLRATADLVMSEFARVGKIDEHTQLCIDKTPSHFCQIGLFHVLFPDAKIVVTSRDVRDMVLSNYFMPDVGGPKVNSDLNLFLDYHQGFYEPMIEHWREVLPEGVLLEVRYEDLVLDHEATVRRILSFLGLKWDPNCLRFHDNVLPLDTEMRVRNELYTTSIGRWRNYEGKHHLFRETNHVNYA